MISTKSYSSSDTFRSAASGSLFRRIQQDKAFYISIALIVVSVLMLLHLRGLPADRLNPSILTVADILLTISVLIVGNTLIGRILDRLISWKSKPVSRYILQMIMGVVFSLASLTVSYLFVKGNFTDSAPDHSQIITLNLFGLAVLLPIFSIYFGIKFIRSWRKSELEAEQLQRANAKSQMMSLKNHLDPHFLFNNLNVLSSLMDTDIEGSKEFLGHFSEVYRTLLRSETEDLVTVSEELKLIDSYAHLLKIRFREGLQLNINVSEADREKCIPPLSLQMLIENVVKHNIATRSKPSKIEVTTKYDFLTVSNNIQLKPFDEKTKSGTGLNNLIARFAHFTEKKVHIHEERGQFHVHLPLISVE